MEPNERFIFPILRSGEPLLRKSCPAAVILIWGSCETCGTIVDVGANIGASTLYFAGNYQQARILAFEPFLESYELLVRNVEGISRISTFNFGLFDRDKQCDFTWAFRIR